MVRRRFLATYTYWIDVVNGFGNTDISIEGSLSIESVREIESVIRGDIPGCTRVVLLNLIPLEH
jgi:hypothetical protein